MKDWFGNILTHPAFGLVMIALGFRFIFGFSFNQTCGCFMVECGIFGLIMEMHSLMSRP